MNSISQFYSQALIKAFIVYLNLYDYFKQMRFFLKEIIVKLNKYLAGKVINLLQRSQKSIYLI